MDYQVEVLAAAIAYAYGNGAVRDTDREEASDMVKFLRERGWRVSRDDMINEYVSDGPIQRALGIDGE